MLGREGTIYLIHLGQSSQLLTLEDYVTLLIESEQYKHQMEKLK